MEEVINEQANTVNSQTAEAEQGKGENTSASYGKFKSADALLSAYNSLQAEFTKRCQRIKELEATANKENSLVEKELVHDQAQSTTLYDKEKILKDYLIQLERGKSNAIVMSDEGVGIKTPTAKPTTIAEAGKLAKEIF